METSSLSICRPPWPTLLCNLVPPRKQTVLISGTWVTFHECNFRHMSLYKFFCKLAPKTQAAYYNPDVAYLLFSIIDLLHPSTSDNFNQNGFILLAQWGWTILVVLVLKPPWPQYASFLIVLLFLSMKIEVLMCRLLHYYKKQGFIEILKIDQRNISTYLYDFRIILS